MSSGDDRERRDDHVEAVDGEPAVPVHRPAADLPVRQQRRRAGTPAPTRGPPCRRRSGCCPASTRSPELNGLRWTTFITIQVVTASDSAVTVSLHDPRGGPRPPRPGDRAAAARRAGDLRGRRGVGVSSSAAGDGRAPARRPASRGRKGRCRASGRRAPSRRTRPTTIGRRRALSSSPCSVPPSTGDSLSEDITRAAARGTTIGERSDGIRWRDRPGHDEHPLHGVRPRRQPGRQASARARADPARRRGGWSTIRSRSGSGPQR